MRKALQLMFRASLSLSLSLTTTKVTMHVALSVFQCQSQLGKSKQRLSKNIATTAVTTSVQSSGYSPAVSTQPTACAPNFLSGAFSLTAFPSTSQWMKMKSIIYAIHSLFSFSSEIRTLMRTNIRSHSMPRIWNWLYRFLPASTEISTYANCVVERLAHRAAQ